MDSTVMNIPAIVVGVFVVFALAFWARYKTFSPDEAMIVTGSFLGSRNLSEDESGRKIKKRLYLAFIHLPLYSIFHVEF